MSSTNSNKILSIEFLRMFLMVLIVFHHMFIDRVWTLCTMFPEIHLYKILQQNLSHAYNGVEGFFIISGFLLYITTFNKNISLVDFIKKKYERLSPVIAFSIIICLIANLFGVLHFNVFANLATILLINQFGICISIGQNPILWYTSALFSGMVLYFYLIKIRTFNPKIIAIVSFCAYILLNIIKHGKFNHPLENYYYVFNIGFLRALGGIGIGILVGYFYKKFEDKIKKFNPDVKIKMCITLGEVISFILVFWWLCIYHSKYNNTIFVIIFTILFILFIIQKGYFSQIFKFDFCGKYQYSLYVVHYIIIKIFGLTLWTKYPQFVSAHQILPIVLMCMIIVIISVLSYHFIERKKWLDF